VEGRRGERRRKEGREEGTAEEERRIQDKI
jgi:hypothetical protein